MRTSLRLESNAVNYHNIARDTNHAKHSHTLTLKRCMPRATSSSSPGKKKYIYRSIVARGASLGGKCYEKDARKKKKKGGGGSSFV